MSKKRENKVGERKARNFSEDKRQPSNERSRNSSRPGYLQPKDKKGTFRSNSEEESTQKRSTRRSDSNTGRAESRPRFLQPKDDSSKSREEKSYPEKKSFQSDRKGKPSFGREKEDNSLNTNRAGKGSYSKERTEKSYDKKVEKRPFFKKDDKPFTRNNEGKSSSYSKGRDSKPSFGSREDKRESFKKDDKPYSRNSEGKSSSYSKGRDNKSSYGNGEDKRASYRNEKEEKPFRNSEGKSSSYSKGRDGKSSYGKGDDKRAPYRNEKGRKPYKKDREDKSGNEEFKERKNATFRKYPEQKDNSEKKEFDKRGGFSERKPRIRKTDGSGQSEDGERKNSGEIRLNRYIANAGICSRRDADLLIQAGEILVNGNVVTEMGYKVKYSDEIRYNNRRLKREKLVYILLNKPKDFITTTDDPENRKTIMQLVEGAGSERIYPVGRLDRNTTGLILLTNDGELADKLSHPSNNIKKLYQVDLDKPITDEDFEKIREGLTLEDGVAFVDQIALVNSERTSLGIQIHSGKNRIVRRIFEHLGYDVVKLDRVMYAGLDKKDLPRGKWRSLSEQEVIRLKYMK